MTQSRTTQTVATPLHAGPGPARPLSPCPSGERSPEPPARRRRRPRTGPCPLDELVAAQDGLVTRAQAGRLGVSPDAVDRRLAARRWEPVHPRVYRDARYPPTEEARVRAAVLWAGEDAVLTGAAAAWWWGLLDPGTAPASITVTVPRRRAPRPRADVQVRRRALDPVDVAEHSGLAVAAPALAVLEATLDPDVPGETLLTRVLTGAIGAGEAVPPPDLTALTAAHARNARSHGSATTGRMLASASRLAAEGALHRIRALLVQDRLPGWCCEYEVTGVVLRLAFPAARVAVDVRGIDTGERPGDGCGDGWRRAVLRRQGWRVLVLDPAEPWQRPAATLAALRLALSGRPTGPGGDTSGRAAG